MNRQRTCGAIVTARLGYRALIGFCAIIVSIVSGARAETYQPVYSFLGAFADGSFPIADLTLDGSTLYGTTQGGGSDQYYGTVFSYELSTGVEQVLHSFSFSVSDGRSPAGGVTVLGSKLYGTTQQGGSPGTGVIYSYDRATDTETVLHNFIGFTPFNDGGQPQGTMTLVGSTLYGTTEFGGVNGVGTIFSYDVNTGAEKVIHSFAGNAAAGSSSGDGASPVAGLTLVGNTLYGTTANGGAHGVGTIFAYDLTTGIESLIYSFAGLVGSATPSSDGSYPLAALSAVGNSLYGTTEAGGAQGFGTVFSYDLSANSEKVLYNFAGIPAGDGAHPYAAVTAVGNTLYGTTQYGGAFGSENAGTVFAVDMTTGSERVVHNFRFNPAILDGFSPVTGLTLVGDTLYGTTSKGGLYSGGTIYAVKVPEPKAIVLALLAIVGCALQRTCNVR